MNHPKTFEDVLASAFIAGFQFANGDDVTDQQHDDSIPTHEQMFDDPTANAAFDKWRAWWAGDPAEEEPKRYYMALKTPEPADMTVDRKSFPCHCAQFSRRHTVRQHEAFDRSRGILHDNERAESTSLPAMQSGD